MFKTVQTKEIKEAILDATDQLLSTFGYKKMTIDDIAREVGIGKGSVYLHFSSKQEIVLSHVDRIVERVKGELQTIANSRVAPSEKLRRMLVARVIVRFNSVQHYSKNLNELLADLRPKLIERRNRHFAEEAEIFAGVIKGAQKKAVFKDGDALEYAQTFLLATNSLLPFSLTARELGKRTEVRERVLRLANLLIEGIEKK